MRLPSPTAVRLLALNQQFLQMIELPSIDVEAENRKRKGKRRRSSRNLDGEQVERSSNYRLNSSSSL